MPLSVQGKSVLILVLAVCVAAAGLARAQNPESAEMTLEEVVVTGSRIARRDFSSTSPILTVSREKLDSAAQPTLEEVLNQMPQIIPDFERTANNPGDGTARLNLRGLGANRTLVLLNGRRLAPSGVGAAIDVNNLPQMLIDRVEIITGGAAAVYGSDAVAGVINFLTRDDFDGFNVSATGYTTEQGDGNIYDVNLSFGHNFADGRGNVTLFGSYYDRDSLFASERRLTAVPIRDGNGVLTEDGSLATPSSVVTFPPVDFGSGPAMTTFDANGLPVEFMDPADRYNYAPLNYLQTPLKRTAIGAMFAYEFSERSEFYSELSYTINESVQNLAPVPVSNLYLTNLDNPVLDPVTQQFFADNFAPPFLPPGTAGFFLSRRMAELGPRIFDRERDYSRVVAGLRGAINSNWNYDVWLTYTKNDEDAYLKNGASAAKFQQGLFVDPGTSQCFDPSNGCVPLNIWGAGLLSAAGVDFLRLPDLINTTSREQKLVSGYVRGSPMETWAGPLEVAIGAEWRRDDGSFRADDALFDGDALGYRGSAGVDGRESVVEVFAEASVPLASNVAFAEYLGLELGARYSNYKNAGSVDTYKFGGEWQPVEALQFRAMFQHSVRAPNIAEAFQDQFVETFAFVASIPSEDPCSASADPVANGRVDACVATGLPLNQIGVFDATVGIPTNFVRGGNPNLKPETADTFTVGVSATFGDSGNWRISLDYFDLEIEDTIGELQATVSCFDPGNSQNLFCDHFTRDVNSYNIIEVRETQTNRGGQKTTGFDTQIAFSAELANSSTLNTNLAWTHTTRNEVKELRFGSTLRCAGRFGFPCNDAADGMTYPDDRVSANVSFLSGDLGVYLNWRWISGTNNAAYLVSEFLGTPDPDLVIAEIPSSSYLDIGVAYQLSEHFHARLNVSNLLDRDPPLMADAVVSNNTDTRLYDIFGRSYSLTVSYQY